MREPLSLSHPFVITNLAQDPEALYQAVLRNQPAFTSMDVYGKTFVHAQVPEAFRDPQDHTFHKGMLKALAEGYGSVVDSLKAQYGAHRLALLVATCDYQSEYSTPAAGAYFLQQHFPEGYSLDLQLPAWSLEYLASQWKVTGISEVLSTACASGASMLCRARDLLEAGFADGVIAVGYDLAYPLVCMGFDSLGVYAPEGTNPSSLNRKGVTLGTGLGALVVRRESRKGDFVLCGCGESNDAFHITGPDPQGTGAELCMRRALEDAGLSEEAIGYLNLHGTGTSANDLMEARAVFRLFGSSIPVSSTKSLTGHTLGASGIIETILCLETLKHGQLPPHHWDGVRDPQIPPLRFVAPKEAYPVPRYCMSNSFAFGGNNVSIIVGVAR